MRTPPLTMIFILACNNPTAPDAASTNAILASLESSRAGVDEHDSTESVLVDSSSLASTGSPGRCALTPSWTAGDLRSQAKTSSLRMGGDGLSLADGSTDGTLTTVPLKTRDYEGLCRDDWKNLSFDADLVDSIGNGDFEAALSPESSAGTPYVWSVDGTTDDADEARVSDGDNHALALSVSGHSTVRTAFDVNPGDMFDLSFDIDTSAMDLSDTLRIAIYVFDDLDDMAAGEPIEIWNPQQAVEASGILLDTLTRYDLATHKRMTIGIQDCDEHVGPGPEEGSTTYTYFGEWSGTDEKPADLSEPCAGRAPVYAQIEFHMKETCDVEQEIGGACPTDGTSDGVLIDNVSLIRKGQVEVDLLAPDGAGNLSVAQTMSWPAGAAVAASSSIFALSARLSTPITSSTTELERVAPVLNEIRLGEAQVVTATMGETISTPITGRLGSTGGAAPIEDWFHDVPLVDVCQNDEGDTIPCWDLLEDLPTTWARMPLYPRVAEVSWNDDMADVSVDLVYGESEDEEGSELDAMDRRCVEAKDHGKQTHLVVSGAGKFWWSDDDDDGEYSYDYDRGDTWNDYVTDYIAFVRLVSEHYGDGPGAGLADMLSFTNTPRVAQNIHIRSMLPHEQASFTYAQQVDLLNQTCHAVEESSYTGRTNFRWVYHDGWMTTDSMIDNLLNREGVFLDGSTGDVLDVACINELSVNIYPNNPYDGAIHIEDAASELAQVFDALEEKKAEYPEFENLSIMVGETGYQTFEQDPSAKISTGVGEDQQAKLFGRDLLTLLSLPFSQVQVYHNFDKNYDPQGNSYGFIKPIDGTEDTDGYLRYEATPAYRTFQRLAGHLGEMPQPVLVDDLSVDTPSDEIVSVKVFASDDGYWVGLWWADRTTFAKRDDAVNHFDDYLDHGMDTERHFELALQGMPEGITSATAYRLGDEDTGEAIDFTSSTILSSSTSVNVTLHPPAVGDMPILIHLGTL